MLTTCILDWITYIMKIHLNKAQELVESWTQDDRNYINKIAPKEGLKAKFKDGTILDIAQKLFEISKQGLDNRNILAKIKNIMKHFI